MIDGSGAIYRIRMLLVMLDASAGGHSIACD